MKRIRLIPVIAVLTLSFPIGGNGQTLQGGSDAGSPPTTSQIAMPAVVIDKAGQPVHGLQKKDFVVNCGKGASLDSVEEVAPVRFNGFSDPIPIFIVFDRISNTKQTEISRQILKYLREAADRHIAVTVMDMSFRGLRVIHDMSTDAKVFSAAIDKLTAGAGQSPGAQASPDNFSIQVDEEVQHLGQLSEDLPYSPPKNAGWHFAQAAELDGLRAIGEMLQRSRKRKVLVWLSGRFPISVVNGDVAVRYKYSPQHPSMEYSGDVVDRAAELNTAYQRAVDSLNQARISLFPIVFEQWDAYTSGQAVGDREIAITRENLDELAQRTGGRLLGTFLKAEDFSNTLADLRRHLDTYYVLNLAVQPSRKTRWVDAKVRVETPDVKIAVANGFFTAN